MIFKKELVAVNWLDGAFYYYYDKDKDYEHSYYASNQSMRKINKRTGELEDQTLVALFLKNGSNLIPYEEIINKTPVGYNEKVEAIFKNIQKGRYKNFIK